MKTICLIITFVLCVSCLYDKHHNRINSSWKVYYEYNVYHTIGIDNDTIYQFRDTIPCDTVYELTN